MCGRFTQLYSWPELVALYRLTMPPQNLQSSYNVCPTDPVDVILPKEGGGHDFARMRWGLVPAWWSKPLKQVPATFNARSEGEAEHLARVAIEAMREPTKEMTEADMSLGGCWVAAFADPTQIWQAMIDEALKDP
jgi:hypothetical protein